MAKMLLTKIVIQAYRRHGDRSCDPKPPPTHPPVSPESAAGLFQAGVLFTDEMQHMMTHKTRRLQATRCQRKLMAALMGVRAARPVCARAPSQAVCGFSSPRHLIHAERHSVLVVGMSASQSKILCSNVGRSRIVIPGVPNEVPGGPPCRTAFSYGAGGVCDIRPRVD